MRWPFIIGILALILTFSCKPAKPSAQPPTSVHQAKNAPTDKPRLLNRNIDAEFSVENGTLATKQGKKEICVVHNDFIIEALKTKMITLNHCDYHALVSTAEIATEGAVDSKNLLLDILKVDLKDGCSSCQPIRKYLEQLSMVDFQTSHISSYEAPTTCYYFTAKGHLVLIGHYGLPSYYPQIDFDSIIALLKES